VSVVQKNWGQFGTVDFQSKILVPLRVCGRFE